MARFYGKKVLKSIIEIGEVPPKWREETSKWIEENS